MCINRCDNCIVNINNNENKLKKKDFIKETKIIIQCIIEIGPHWTVKQISGVCKGSNNSSTRKIYNLTSKKAFGALSNYSIQWIKGLIRNLVQKDMLCELIALSKNNFVYRKIGVTEKGRNILFGKIKLEPWVPDSDMIENINNCDNNNNNVFNKNVSTQKTENLAQCVRKKKPGNRWSEEDDKYLWNHKDDNKKDLGEYFGKTVHAIRSRLKHLMDENHSAYIRLFGKNNINNIGLENVQEVHLNVNNCLPNICRQRNELNNGNNVLVMQNRLNNKKNRFFIKENSVE
eukprot:109632_1